jgi:hypothetical protein
MEVHSSTSSSDAARDAYARETASDRPGVAQPVPLRPVPVQPWGRILLGTVLALALLVGAWEHYWRAYGVTPSIRNSYGLWAIQRRRIDAGEGDATVLLGASRMYFDLQLPAWERLAGRAPIQLSYEGTSPLTAVEDLAADPKFTGRLLIGVEPDLFFSGDGFALDVAHYTHKQSPAQRIGQWLSMTFVEPYFAFYDSDYALRTVLARQPWPKRPGKHWFTEVRKLSMHEADRDAYLWDKVDSDPQYRALARSIWLEEFVSYPGDPTPEEMLKTEKEQIERAVKALAQLRAHGVQVLFLRLPSDGPYLSYEDRLYPRARAWDGLMAATRAPGIYFSDYPQLRGYYLPEWSLMTRAEAERFTVALYGVIQKDFWGPRAPVAAAVTASQ